MTSARMSLPRGRERSYPIVASFSPFLGVLVLAIYPTKGKSAYQTAGITRQKERSIVGATEAFLASQQLRGRMQGQSGFPVRLPEN